jgi:hypothetical protein
MKAIALLLLVILPGTSMMALSTYYLFPEWTALTVSHKNFETLAKSPSASINQLFVAQSAENRHRINCFAEGMGVLLGMVITSIGIHGICTLPQNNQRIDI